LKQGRSGESLFFDLALSDITQAADIFRTIHDQTSGVDGWASLELSPSLAYDPTKTLSAAKELFARADRPNVFIKIPRTKEGLQAIEDAIFAGVPLNVTLLFSADQYVAAAHAYLRGVERRIEAAINPVVASVAAVFISRWDVKQYLFQRANSTSRSLTIFRTNVSWLATPHEQADVAVLIKWLMISSITSSFDAMALRSNWFL